MFAGFDAGVAALNKLLRKGKVLADEQVVVLGDLQELFHGVLLYPQHTNDAQQNRTYFTFGAFSVDPQFRIFFVFPARKAFHAFMAMAMMKKSFG